MAATRADVAIRPLARQDLDAVVAIDAAIEGRPRRGYFERRLQAALEAPKLHAQFAAADGSGLAGYILARVLEGEFGRSEPALRLEVVGVRADAQGHGIGRRLFDALARLGPPARHARPAHAGHVERPRDGALARRDAIRARAEPRRRLRRGRRRVRAVA